MHSAILAMALAAAVGVSANPITPRYNTPTERLLVSGPGFISTTSFDGHTFANVNLQSFTGQGPSWVMQKDGFLYSVDENANAITIYSLSADGKLTSEASVNGSSGVVHLEFNADKTRMVGSAYGSGRIDFWDVSGEKTLKPLKQIDAPGATADKPSHPHQALLDPSGRFYAVNDLGTNKILIIDGKDDAFAITTEVSLDSLGTCGPRHGSFFPPPGVGTNHIATHYFVVCELGNVIHSFQVEYADDTIKFSEAKQTISTYDPANGPASITAAAAGELLLAIRGPAEQPTGADIYVTNRLTGRDTDNVAHFTLTGTAPGHLDMAFVSQVSSRGTRPRSLALGQSGSVLYCANQAGLGLIAIPRNAESGELTPEPIATIANQPFNQANQTDFGPQYVMIL